MQCRIQVTIQARYTQQIQLEPTIPTTQHFITLILLQGSCLDMVWRVKCIQVQLQLILKLLFHPITNERIKNNYLKHLCIFKIVISHPLFLGMQPSGETLLIVYQNWEVSGENNEIGKS